MPKARLNLANQKGGDQSREKVVWILETLLLSSEMFKVPITKAHIIQLLPSQEDQLCTLRGLRQHLTGPVGLFFFYRSEPWCVFSKRRDLLETWKSEQNRKIPSWNSIFFLGGVLSLQKKFYLQLSKRVINKNPSSDLGFSVDPIHLHIVSALPPEWGVIILPTQTMHL